MKRYLLFCGDDYYPGGGMEDFVGDFDTLDEAIARSARVEYPSLRVTATLTIPARVRTPDWAHVWDTETRQMVYDTDEE